MRGVRRRGKSGDTERRLPAIGPPLCVDGQLYGVAYDWESPIDPSPWYFISVLIHTYTSASEVPTWTENIALILTQYAKLYPIMAHIPDGLGGTWSIGDYDDVRTHEGVIRHLLTLPKSDPAHMPVTRDLPTSKLRMILEWFEAGAPH